MDRALPIVGRNCSAWQSHRLEARPTLKQQQHVAISDRQGSQPLIREQRAQSKDVRIEHRRPIEIIDVEYRFENLIKFWHAVLTNVCLFPRQAGSRTAASWAPRQCLTDHLESQIILPRESA